MAMSDEKTGELQRLIQEGIESGRAEPWDAEEVKRFARSQLKRRERSKVEIDQELRTLREEWDDKPD